MTWLRSPSKKITLAQQRDEHFIVDVKRLGARDGAPFDRFYRGKTLRLQRRVATGLRSAGEAREIVQETFVRLITGGFA